MELLLLPNELISLILEKIDIYDLLNLLFLNKRIYYSAIYHIKKKKN